jgi:hypothetical protein
VVSGSVCVLMRVLVHLRVKVRVCTYDTVVIIAISAPSAHHTAPPPPHTHTHAHTTIAAVTGSTVARGRLKSTRLAVASTVA